MCSIKLSADTNVNILIESFTKIKSLSGDAMSKKGIICMAQGLDVAAKDLPKIISVDDRVLEPLGLWSRRLPKKFLDRGPARDKPSCTLLD